MAKITVMVVDPETLDNTVWLTKQTPAKCPWCKEGMLLSEIESHKNSCPHRRPVPTVTGIDKTGPIFKKKRRY